MSADGAADLRRRAAPSARTRHGGDAIDAAEVIRLRVKRAPMFTNVLLFVVPEEAEWFLVCHCG